MDCRATRLLPDHVGCESLDARCSLQASSGVVSSPCGVAPWLGCRLSAADSTDRCSTLRELFGWGLIEQGLSGAFIGLPCYRAEFGLAMLRLLRIQSLSDVRDQVGRVLYADREPDRGVENPDFFADVGRHAGMRHARGQARKRLGAAQAHRHLKDLQRVEEFKCRGLAADDVERERGARAGALPLEQKAGRGVLVKVSKVMDLGPFGMAKQVIRPKPRVRVGFFHADAQRFERSAEHPAGMRIQLGAYRSAQRLDVFHERFWAERSACNEI